MSKNVSQRTKDVKKRAVVYFIISTLMTVGVVLFIVSSAFTTIGGTESTGKDILSEALKAQIISLSVTAIICLLLILIIKDKIRHTLYMLSIIIAAIIYKEVGMYIVAGIWFVDEYIIHALYKRYKNLITINKEIDLRG